MCIICVQIMREKISLKEAMTGFREAVNGSIDQIRSGGSARDGDMHAADILNAEQHGDTKKVNELVKAGYKKERWL